MSAAFGLLAAFWALAGLWHGWRLWRWPRLERGRAPSELPFVSLLLPARDEAGRMLETCVRSLLAQNYPRFEIVAVDDCSTDDTRRILEDLARGDDRLRVLAGAEPETGWRGKPWALEQARRAARGEWLLVVDADITLAPDVLSDAVALAQREGWDAVTLMPRHGSDDFWVRAAMPVYEWIVTFGLPFVHRDGAGDDRASACGAFFLMRWDALERAGGFAAVRDRVAEDVTLARRLKASGSRLTYRRATDRFWTPHYENGPELLRGFAKNLWTPEFGVARGIVLALVLLLLGLGPFTGALLGHPLGLMAFAVQIAALAPAYAGRGKGWLPWRAALGPGVLAAMGGVVLAVLLRHAAGHGITWKGRTLHAPGAGKGG